MHFTGCFVGRREFFRKNSIPCPVRYCVNEMREIERKEAILSGIESQVNENYLIVLNVFSFHLAASSYHEYFG